METYELSETYYKEKFIKSISLYFNIPRQDIKKNYNFLNTRMKLREKYKEINNIKDFSVCDAHEADNILSMVKSSDEASVILGIDLFFTSFFKPSKELYELLHFLNVLANYNTDSLFCYKFHTFLYLLDTGDRLDCRFIEFYKIASVVKDFPFAPQESIEDEKTI